MRAIRFIFMLAAGLLLLPLAGLLLCGVSEALTGCQSLAGPEQTCLIWGFDVGPIVGMALVFGSLLYLTLPLLGVLVALWLTIELAVAWTRRRRRQRRAVKAVEETS